VGDVGAFEIEFTGAWYWQRATIDDPIPSEDAPPPPGLPSWEEAEARFRVILAELGFDPDQGTFAPFEAARERQLSFAPRIGGLEVVDGLDAAIGFGEHGRIEFASGYLGAVDKLGEYPLAPVRGAFAAADIAFSGGPAPDDAVETTVVEVTSADLVLEVVFPFCDRADFTLVPSYRLRSPDGIDHHVPAAAPSSVADADADDESSCPDEQSLDDPPGRRPPAARALVPTGPRPRG
jgi:hypothetical protein